MSATCAHRDDYGSTIEYNMCILCCAVIDSDFSAACWVMRDIMHEVAWALHSAEDVVNAALGGWTVDFEPCQHCGCVMVGDDELGAYCPECALK